MPMLQLICNIALWRAECSSSQKSTAKLKSISLFIGKLIEGCNKQQLATIALYLVKASYFDCGFCMM